MPLSRLWDVVCFDLDGTLVDTAPDLAAALNHSLACLGRETVDPASVRHLVGHGARALLRHGLAAAGEASEELVERGFPLFMEHYAANICVGSRPYAHLEAMLDTLVEEGVRLAICTNKPERLTHALLHALGWEHRFRAVVGADTLPVRKPDPLPLWEAITRAGGGRAVLVGDSITDADTARAAQVPFIAVTFGFSDRPAHELGADLLIDSYVELVPALSKLGGARESLMAEAS
jgi:phosphoglycolate phosphatase